jgi:hypothetical protein
MAIDSGSVGNPVGAGVRVAYALAILTDSRPKAKSGDLQFFNDAKNLAFDYLGRSDMMHKPVYEDSPRDWTSTRLARRHERSPHQQTAFCHTQPQHDADGGEPR